MQRKAQERGEGPPPLCEPTGWQLSEVEAISVEPGFGGPNETISIISGSLRPRATPHKQHSLSPRCDGCEPRVVGKTKPRLAIGKGFTGGSGLATFAVRITACRHDSRVTVAKQSCDRPQLAQKRVYAPRGARAKSSVTVPPSLSPEVLEPSWRQLGVAHRVLDRAVAEPILQRQRIMSRIRQSVAAGMPEHVAASAARSRPHRIFRPNAQRDEPT